MATAKDIFREDYVRIVGDWAKGQKCFECREVLTNDWEPMWFISSDEREFLIRTNPGKIEKFENGMFGPSKRSFLRLFEENNAKYRPVHSLCHQRALKRGTYSVKFPTSYQEWRRQVTERFETITGFPVDYLVLNFRWHGPLEMGTLFDRRADVSAKKHVEMLLGTGGSFIRVRGDESDLAFYKPTEKKNLKRRQKRQDEYLASRGKEGGYEQFKVLKKMRADERERKRKEKDNVTEPAPPPANPSNN